MANTRFYLDARGAKSNTPRVLKIAIAHKGSSSLISLPMKLLPNQWDNKKQRVINHSDQLLVNVYISGIKQQIDTMLLTLANEGRLGNMQPAEIKEYIDSQLNPEKAEAKKTNR